MSKTKSALIIANYQYQDPELRQLVAPAQDAESLARVLANPAIGGFEVRTLINEPSHKVNLEIESFCDNRKRDDLLLLYFSGHGIKDSDSQLYFATVDTQLVQHNVRRATAVSAHFVNEVMSRSRSRRQILLLDCCYSGAFKEGMLARSGRRVGAGEQFEGQGRVVLTASDALQYSFEGEQVQGEGIRSVFTSTLVHGLETGEADLDRDGSYAFDEVYDYVHARVSEKQPDQKPMKMGYVEGKIFIGNNPHPRAADLPPELQESLEDRRPWVRLSAVPELEALLIGKHTGLALAAQTALASLATHDYDLRIRSAAEKSLAAHVKAVAKGSQEAATERAAEATRRTQEEEAGRERDRLEAERLAAEKREAAERERLAQERDGAAELRAAWKAESERLTRDLPWMNPPWKAEAERLARDKAEAERVAQLKAEQERLARERAAREEENRGSGAEKKAYDHMLYSPLNPERIPWMKPPTAKPEEKPTAPLPHEIERIETERRAATEKERRLRDSAEAGRAAQLKADRIWVVAAISGVIIGIIAAGQGSGAGTTFWTAALFAYAVWSFLWFFPVFWKWWRSFLRKHPIANVLWVFFPVFVEVAIIFGSGGYGISEYRKCRRIAAGAERMK